MADSTSSTIVAVSTPPGRGGIGVVRLSGSKAKAIAEQISRSKLEARKPRLANFWIQDQAVDQGLLLWFPEPASFTGQDVVEFQAHGSPVVLRLLVEECIRRGASPAEPGEFSKLAFLNDKLDLTQAEAIADLIDAGSAAAVRAAARSLDGSLSRHISELQDQLIELRVFCESAIDFVDEDIEFLEQGDFHSRLLSCGEAVAQCEASASSSRILKEGLKLVILGRPNAGKSSLLNQLAGTDRAIVTDIAGTTRDTLHEVLDLDGLPLEITDTAGLNESPDPVEKIGIERAIRSAQGADLVLALFDDNNDSLESTQTLLAEYFKDESKNLPVIYIGNKIDLSGNKPGYQRNLACLRLSAKTGAGLPELKKLLKERANYSDQEPEFLARERHLLALRDARQHIETASNLLSKKTSPELIAEELRLSHLALQKITGAVSADDFLGEIFSRFCIGK